MAKESANLFRAQSTPLVPDSCLVKEAPFLTLIKTISSMLSLTQEASWDLQEYCQMPTNLLMLTLWQSIVCILASMEITTSITSLTSTLKL
jgi:hypothetical protein